jgi:hypothetical protein
MKSIEQQYEDEIDQLKEDKACLLHALRQMFEGDNELAISTLTAGGFTEDEYMVY